MAGKVMLFCIVCTILMFYFPPLGRLLGPLVGLSLLVLVFMGWSLMIKAMIKFFNYLNDSEIQN